MTDTAPAPAPAPEEAGASRLGRWRQSLGWLRGYQIGWLRGDLIAGVTLAAYLLPAAIGDASLANLPPQAGIYACLFSGLVFWLFCSSRHTSITVTSAISLLLGSTLGELAQGDTTRFGMLAATTALMVAVIAFVAWLVRAGLIVRFISETVMVGFKCGIALVLASTQLPKLCGFSGGHGDFWDRTGHFLRALDQTNGTALLLGLGALAVLLLGKRLLPGKPVALLVVVGGIVAARRFDLGATGVKLLGDVPQGLPALGVPLLTRAEINLLFPLALACFLLAAVESAAIGRMFARKHGYRLDADQEFLAIGAANLASGLGSGFPVSGGMSQSLVNESAGARTPLTGLIASFVILLVALLWSELLSALPQPVLAAIVLMAVTSLFQVRAMRHLWRAHRGEFVIACLAMLGVLGSGILRGVLIGSVISLIVVLRRAARPHVAFLGRIPGLQRFSDMERNPENEPIPGALLLRVEGSLYYFNVEAVRDAITARLQRAAQPIRLVVWDLSTSPHVDMAGAELLTELHEDLSEKGIRLQVVEARSRVRDMLRLEGLEEKLGHISRRHSLSQVVAEFIEARA